MEETRSFNSLSVEEREEISATEVMTR
jgi:hypothetical protein